MTKNLLYTILALLLTSLSMNAQCPTANAGADKTICQGDTVYIAGNVTLGSPQWSTPKPAPITLPFQIPGAPSSITPPSPVTFIPIGNSDTTKNDTVRVTIGMAIPSLTGLTGGGVPAPKAATYTFHYTITQTGCPTSTDSMTILVQPLPTAAIVPNGNANQSSCTGATTFTAYAPICGGTDLGKP